MSSEDLRFEELERRLRIMLPSQYEGRYDEVKPTSMGSAGLRYDDEGRVAWDRIWGSFCDLAMAGGPPHRGTLLEPGRPDEIAAQPEQYGEVVAEICRGVALVTGLWAEPAPDSGWVRLHCTSAGMTGWLTRALLTENVSARFRGLRLYLPAGPAYRLEKEIKNVVTATAKTCHYWLEHTSADRHWEISQLLAAMEAESPLLQPGLPPAERPADGVAQSISRATGLRCSASERPGWLLVDCGTVEAAVWIMRLLIVSNVTARREETRVLVPANSVADPAGARMLQLVSEAHRFAVANGVC